MTYTTHYTYVLEHEPSGYFYIGVNSTNERAEDTHYWGSGTLLWEIYMLQGYRRWHFNEGQNPPDWKKDVICTFPTRKEALDFERATIMEMFSSDFCLNLKGPKQEAIKCQRRKTAKTYFGFKYLAHRAQLDFERGRELQKLR